MLGGCGSVCLVVLAAVAISASPFDRRGSDEDEVPEACRNALVVCGFPAISPYIGLNETQILEKVRDTPLSEHCSVWTTAGECARREINGGSCSAGVGESIRGYFVMALEAYDFISKYICTDHFDVLSRNFRCLTNPDIMKDVKGTCDLSRDDPDKICETVNKYIDCTEGIVKAKCGEEAASANKDFTVKLLEKYDQFVLGKDCTFSKRTNQLELIRKFLSDM